MTPRKRTDLLSAVVAHELPIEPVIAQLAELPWDSEVLIELCPQHVVAILDRYLRSELSAEQVAEWAERIECRDDIGFAQTSAETTKEAIFTLANSKLNEPFSHAGAERLRTRLLQVD